MRNAFQPVPVRMAPVRHSATRFTVGADAVNNNGQTSMDRSSLEAGRRSVCMHLLCRILRQSSGHILRSKPMCCLIGFVDLHILGKTGATRTKHCERCSLAARALRIAALRTGLCLDILEASGCRYGTCRRRGRQVLTRRSFQWIFAK